MTIILSNLNRFKILKIGSDLTDPDKIRCFSRLSLLPQAKFCHNLQRGVGQNFWEHYEFYQNISIVAVFLPIYGNRRN